MTLSPAAAGTRPLLLVVLALVLTRTDAAESTVLDGFESAAGWSVSTGPGAAARLAAEPGGALRLDYAQPGDTAAIVLRKRFPMPLPENPAFRLRLRGSGRAFDVDFKVLDEPERNVWWLRRYGVRLDPGGTELRVPRRDLGYAWGLDPGQPLRQLGAVELDLTPAAPGQGSLWLDDLALEALPPPYASKASANASSALPAAPPQAVLDELDETYWLSLASDRKPWLQIDFGTRREYGGVSLLWEPQRHATAYRLEASDDGRRWRTLYTVRHGNGGRDDLPLAEACSRYLRLRLLAGPGRGYGLRSLGVDAAETSNPNRYLALQARQQPAGHYPRSLLGQQPYYTVVGADRGDPAEAVLDTDGNLETEKGGFSITPFVYSDGRLWGWTDGTTSASLLQDYLPIPSVTRDAGPWRLTTTAYAAGSAPASTLYARYRLENTGDRPLKATLFLALRPYQVVPPWQSLNMEGGVAPIHSLGWSGRAVRIDGVERVLPLTRPSGFGAAAFDREPLSAYLANGRLPPDTQAHDPSGFATGVLRYDLRLAPGAARNVDLALPFGHERPRRRVPPTAADAALQSSVDHWSRRLNGVTMRLPPAAPRLAEGLRSNLAYLLIHRDGAALQPGSRNYDRIWIRDGALISSALLQTGHAAEVRAFLLWYAPLQLADGTMPCCIDHRGPDQVVENDSNGEFLYTLAEYHRYSGDRATVDSLWTRVQRVVARIEELRAQRLTDVYRTGEGRAFFGLMPESISHEGYGGHPVHAFWDDFWTLRGLKDAAYLAQVAGQEATAARFRRLGDDFAADVYRALDGTMERHRIAYLPASVELADFDSNAIAQFVGVIGEQHRLPPAALARTFDDWYDYFRRRKTGRVPWDSYTPYEIRLVEALVRLGRREHALELLDWLLAGQRPAAWHQWAEVVWRDPLIPNFLGDMPHGWIGAEFIRAVLSLFAYERDADQTLVLAAGLPSAWVESPGGVAIHGLRTRHGRLDYELTATSPGKWRLNLAGELAAPGVKLVVQLPADRTLQGVEVNGATVKEFGPHEAVVSVFPAEVILQLAPFPAL